MHAVARMVGESWASILGGWQEPAQLAPTPLRGCRSRKLKAGVTPSIGMCRARVMPASSSPCLCSPIAPAGSPASWAQGLPLCVQDTVPLGCLKGVAASVAAREGVEAVTPVVSEEVKAAGGGITHGEPCPLLPWKTSNLVSSPYSCLV